MMAGTVADAAGPGAPRARSAAVHRPRRPGMVARRRHLRGLSASFADANGDGSATSRAFGRGSATSATSASTPSGSPPGTLAARRRRLRRRRLPGHRSDLRDAPGSRGAHRRGARARHPDHHRHRPQPRVRRAPLVPGGARGRSRRRPERDRFWFRPGEGRTGRAAHRLALELLGRPPGPARRTRTAPRRVVPPPVRGRSSRTSTGTTRTSGRARGHPPVLVRPRRRPACGSTPRRCSSRTRRCPRSRTSRRRAPTPTTDRDEVHDIYRALAADR